jgi:hypothetical protein
MNGMLGSQPTHRSQLSNNQAMNPQPWHEMTLQTRRLCSSRSEWLILGCGRTQKAATVVRFYTETSGLSPAADTSASETRPREEWIKFRETSVFGNRR